MRAIIIGLACAAVAMPVHAKEMARLAPPALDAAMQVPPAVETVQIEVASGAEVLWAGSLRLGGPYGSASFSQSRNEYAVACAGEPDNGNRSSSQSLNVNLSRYNWQQQPDRFNLSVNWTRPLQTCGAEGSDSYGLNRMLTLARGQRLRVEGEAGMTVTLTRAR